MPSSRLNAIALAGALLSAVYTSPSLAQEQGPAQLTHGVASGQVTAASAVVWGRCSGPARLRVGLHGPGAMERTAEASAEAAHDFVGKVLFQELRPDMPYEYTVSCAEGVPEQGRGSFRTAPSPQAAKPVRFGWSGDLGGQNVCRDEKEGYAIFDLLREKKLDFFIGVGDMVYADDVCRPVGRYRNKQVSGPGAAVDLPGFWAHWRYNRIDPASQRFLATTPYLAVWDDHEIKNDAGPAHDVLPQAEGRHLLGPAAHAFVDYLPEIVDPLPEASTDTGSHLYRTMRWGKHVELFLLDTRHYRDSNFDDDDAKHPKTLLGAAQRRWLLDAMALSDATWRIVVCSVPLSIPTGSDARGRDGFANFDQSTGFENEALSILRFLHEHGVRNHLWITTDVHFANVFRYTPFAKDPGWSFHEVTTGPLTAGIFPRLQLDPTFNPERLFMHGPKDPTKISGYAEARHWFNFGVIEVAANGDLTLSIVTGRNETAFELKLPAKP